MEDILKKIKEYGEAIVFLFSCGISYKFKKDYGLDNCEIILIVVTMGSLVGFIYFLRKGYWRYSLIAIVLTGVTLGSIFGACIDAWFWLHQVKPFPKDTIGIYISRFRGDYGTTYREEIFQALNVAIEGAGLSKRVVVRRLPRRIYGDKGSLKALTYGLRGNAKLVIWGSFPSEKKIRAWITCTDPYFFMLGKITWIVGSEGEITVSSKLSEIQVPEELIEEPLSLVNLIVALSYGRAGEHEEAIFKLEEILKTRRDFAEAHYFLGNEYEEERNYEKAIQAYKVAMDLSIKKETPLYVLSGVNMAHTYLYGVKDTDKAIEILKKILESHQDSSMAHMFLGVAYAMKGIYSFAESEINIAIELLPDYADAHAMLGAIYEDESKYDEAIHKYKKVLQICPNYEFKDADIDMRIVNACAKKGGFEVAVEAWKVAMGLEPDYMFYQRLGAAYYDVERLEDAVKAFKKVIEIKPDYYFTYVFLSIIHFKQVQLRDAIEAYFKLQELQPELAKELFIYLRKLVASDRNLIEKLREQVVNLNWEEQKVANKLLSEPRN